MVGPARRPLVLHGGGALQAWTQVLLPCVLGSSPRLSGSQAGGPVPTGMLVPWVPTTWDRGTTGQWQDWGQRAQVPPQNWLPRGGPREKCCRGGGSGGRGSGNGGGSEAPGSSGCRNTIPLPSQRNGTLGTGHSHEQTQIRSPLPASLENTWKTHDTVTSAEEARVQTNLACDGTSTTLLAACTAPRALPCAPPPRQLEVSSLAQTLGSGRI